MDISITDIKVSNISYLPGARNVILGVHYNFTSFKDHLFCGGVGKSIVCQVTNI